MILRTVCFDKELLVTVQNSQIKSFRWKPKSLKSVTLLNKFCKVNWNFCFIRKCWIFSMKTSFGNWEFYHFAKFELLPSGISHLGYFDIVLSWSNCSFWWAIDESSNHVLNHVFMLPNWTTRKLKNRKGRKTMKMLFSTIWVAKIFKRERSSSLLYSSCFFK